MAMTDTAEVDMAEQSEGTGKRVARATVASALSGLIAYGIRRAAPTIKQKLESVGENGSVPGADALGKAKDAVGEKVEAATSAVTERLPVGSSGQSRSTGSLSEKQLETRLRERAQHRRERQKALKS
jgi:hypothetical protein